MGNQQQDYCSVFTAEKLPDDTRCDRRQLHVYGLLPPSVAHDSQMAAFSFVRELQRKPWRSRPRCTDCWMDRGRLHVDCYHDSRATETGPSFQQPSTYTAVTVADSAQNSAPIVYFRVYSSCIDPPASK